MENFDFDNRLKEGLENIDPMLNNDEIWDNIEPHLKKKKKRRFIIWFFFGALGILGLLWFQFDDYSEDKSLSGMDVQQETSNGSIALNSGEKDLAGEASEKSSVAIEEKIVPSKTINANTKNPKPYIHSTQKESTLHKNPSRTSFKNLPKNNLIRQEDKVEQISLVSTSNITEIAKTKPYDNLDIDQKSLTSSKETITKAETKNNFSTTSIINQPVEIEQEIPTIKQALIEENDQEVEEEKKERINSSQDISTQPEVKKKLTKKERQQANKQRKEARKKAKEEKEKKKKEAKKKADEEKKKLTIPNKIPKWKFQIQLTGSGIYTLHSLRDKNQSESSYLNHRSKYVSGIEGFDTKLNFIAENSSGLILTGGIEYQQLHEILKRVEEVSETELEEVQETITEDAQGNIINETSTMQLVTTTTFYNQKLYNQYRFINFPIGIGYTFKRGKMRLRFVGGIDLNTYFRFSGSTFDRELNILELNSNSFSSYDKIFKKTLGVGVWANIEWHRPISDRLSLVIAPGIQSPIGSISQDNEDWPISHRLYKLKLSLGINYILGNIKKPKKRSRKR